MQITISGSPKEIAAYELALKIGCSQRLDVQVKLDSKAVAKATYDRLSACSLKRSN